MDTPGGEAFVYDAIRTPRGKLRGGSLHAIKPIDLVVGLIREIATRHPNLDPATIDDVVLGIVSPLGDQGGVLPRAAAVVAGLPHTVAGVQLNRFCSSGLEAVNQAGARIRSGWEAAILAGGVESMSRVAMGSDGGPMFTDPTTSHDMQFVPQGIGADLLATLEGFDRDDVDRFAVRSQQLADTAWREGRFTRSIVAVTDVNGLVVCEQDEHRRPGSTVDALGALKPSFATLGRSAGFDDVALQRYHWLEAIDHVHTAANSSGVVDGAALVLVGSDALHSRYGLEPRARIVSAAVSGADPTIMLTGPTPASRKALDLAGLTVNDIDLFEINEAFAAVALKWQRDLKIPDEKLNVNGGAIAMGHPLGATGAMLVGIVLDELERRHERRALISLCVGGGMGIATILERV